MPSALKKYERNNWKNARGYLVRFSSWPQHWRPIFHSATIFRNVGSIPKMSTYVLSYCRNYMAKSLVKSFGESCRGMVLPAARYWPSNHCIPAQTFVSVWAGLNHNRSPWVLVFDKDVPPLFIFCMNWIWRLGLKRSRYYVTRETQASVCCENAAIHCSRWGEVQVPWLVFTNDGRQNKEIDTRIGKANAGLRELYRSLVAKWELSTVPLLCGRESRGMNERVISQVQVAEMGSLRNVHGLTLRDRCEICRLLNVEPLLHRIERSQLLYVVSVSGVSRVDHWRPSLFACGEGHAATSVVNAAMLAKQRQHSVWSFPLHPYINVEHEAGLVTNTVFKSSVWADRPGIKILTSASQVCAPSMCHLASRLLTTYISLNLYTTKCK